MIQQPIGTDQLDSPSHSLSHRVVANDDSAPAESIVVDSAGNVGIGTAAPGAKLSILESSVFTTSSTPGIDTVFLHDNSNDGTGNYGASIGFSRLGTGDMLRKAAISAVETGANRNAVGLAFFGSSGLTDGGVIEEFLRISSSGNVGIGTTNPGYALEVTGDTYLSATTTLGDDLQVNSRIITVSNGGNTHHVSPGGDLSSFVVIDKNNTGSDASLLLADQGDLKWEIGMAGDNNLYWKKVTGSAEDYTFENLFKMDYDTARIGIGTEAPGAKFEIASSSPTARVEMIISNKSTTGTDGTALRLAAETDGDAWYIGSDAGLNGGDNFFINDGTFGEGIFIDASNNVGIHDTSLTYPFEVTGDSYFTGNATTTGAGYFGGDLRVVGTLDSSDIRFDNGFILTEGDKVGLDKNELILLNEKGEVAFRFLSDGTLIAKNGIKQEPVKQNYWYLLGLLGLLGLVIKRK